MPKLPQLSGKELIKILISHRYREIRTKGSHVRLYPPTDESGLQKVTVPLHKSIKHGTLHAIMKDSGLTIEDLM